MDEHNRRILGVPFKVDVTVPRLSRADCDRLVTELHRGDRRLGVISGGRGDRHGLSLLTAAADVEAVRSKSERSLAAAIERAGVTEAIAGDVRIEAITVGSRSPGSARPVRLRPAATDRTLSIPDGRTLRVAYEGPLGNWIACLEGEPEHAWSARALGSALSELLELSHGKKDEWVLAIVRQLAGRETPLGTRYACPCCDYWTLECTPGSHATCPVCGWEDDWVQFRDLDYRGGANGPSLREAREHFRRVGFSQERSGGRGRPPLLEESPPLR